jgi:uncharacterized heparinase superfamily protein
MRSPTPGLESLFDIGRGVPLPEFATAVTLSRGPESRPTNVGPSCDPEPRATDGWPPLSPRSRSTIARRPNLGLYWRTVRHLRWSQIGYLAARRLLRPQFFNRQSAISNRQYDRATSVRLRRLPELRFPEWQPELARQMIESGEFRFLNLSVPTHGRIPWSAPELPRLWTYHLNYCDFLNLDFNRAEDPTGALLRAALRMALDWCEQSSSGATPGWEPYPLSLRVVNWLKFLGRNARRAEVLGETAALARMFGSLRAQVLALEHRLEKDLLANHLLKNIKALIFAGSLLEAPESRRWLAKGQELLRREIAEQILPDGGHFERSPMYHALALEDLMDIRDLSFCLPASEVAPPSWRPEAARWGKVLSETTFRMRGYLGLILHPDGEIPLFNDSALGVAQSPSELLARAEHLALAGTYQGAGRSDLAGLAHTFACASSGIGRPSADLKVCASRSTSGVTTDALADTGYAIIRDRDLESCLVFDAGPLGPDYQPGHGHCDILSYELSLHGQRVVVDTGVSTYEPGPQRHYERSTAAHNTLRIDGDEQAEIWGAFRVGRRPDVGRLASGEIERMCFARGEYQGCRGVVHSRTVLYTAGNCWFIVDCLRGRGLHRAESFVHFHPSVQLEVCQPRRNRNEHPPARGLGPGAETMRRRALVSFGRYCYLLMTLGLPEMAVSESWYSPEFGLRLPSRFFSLAWESRLSNMLVYAFVPAGHVPPVVGIVPNGKAIEINGRTVPL